MPLELGAVPWTRDEVREIVDRIKAQPVYLQDFTSLSDRSFIRWLGDNLPEAIGPIRRVAIRHPLRLARLVVELGNPAHQPTLHLLQSGHGRARGKNETLLVFSFGPQFLQREGGQRRAQHE